jgi:CRISPR-associated protein Cmr3
MTARYLQLTASDPIVARDGRPFGVGQGNRMKGLGWPYPSVVAGSFRTALVKATRGDFTGDTPRKLLGISVAGVFPIADGALYLPAPNDCVVRPENEALRVSPQDRWEGGCDFPAAGLRPVMLTEEQAKRDFKPQEAPAWWPAEKLADRLTRKSIAFDHTFLTTARLQIRDHVQLEPVTGAAAESRLFATAGLGLTHLSRFGRKEGPFADKYAGITLSARIETDDWNVSALNLLHPLGGERRLVHWQANGKADLWKRPPGVADALAGANRVRMVHPRLHVQRGLGRPPQGDGRQPAQGYPGGAATASRVRRQFRHRRQRLQLRLADPDRRPVGVSARAQLPRHLRVVHLLACVEDAPPHLDNGWVERTRRPRRPCRVERNRQKAG